MSDLIEALQIFLKYGNEFSPTHCQHDILYVCVNPDYVTLEDKEKLRDLSFRIEDGYFYSLRFGSC